MAVERPRVAHAAGLRPEHFEDAAVADERQTGGMKFKVTIDVVESMGSELYVYFDVESQEVESEELADLAKDAGMEDLPGGGAGQHVVARLDSASKASPGGEVELTLDTTQIKLFDPNGGRSLTHSGNGAGARAASAGATV